MTKVRKKKEINKIPNNIKITRLKAVTNELRQQGI